jgi:hypothetical protein
MLSSKIVGELASQLGKAIEPTSAGARQGVTTWIPSSPREVTCAWDVAKKHHIRNVSAHGIGMPHFHHLHGPLVRHCGTPWEGLIDSGVGEMMTSREILQYRRLNSGDQATFNRWLAINSVAGGVVFALIAITSIFSGGELSSGIAGNRGVIQHADAK